MFINHIKLSTVRFLVNKNQLKKQILQKELQIKKLHLHQSSTKNCILEKIKKTFSPKKTLICDNWEK